MPATNGTKIIAKFRITFQKILETGLHQLDKNGFERKRN